MLITLANSTAILAQEEAPDAEVYCSPQVHGVTTIAIKLPEEILRRYKFVEGEGHVHFEIVGTAFDRTTGIRRLVISAKDTAKKRVMSDEMRKALGQR